MAPADLLIGHMGAKPAGQELAVLVRWGIVEQERQQRLTDHRKRLSEGGGWRC